MSDISTEYSNSQLIKSSDLTSQFSEDENEDIRSQNDNLSDEDLLNIFSTNENSPKNEEEKVDEIKLYFNSKIQKEEKKIDNQKQIESTPKKSIFKINVSSPSLNESTLLTKKRRGRQTSNKNGKAHDKNSTDNLLRKIQVHYMTFIICFINEILNQLNYQQTFLKLDYEYKKNVSKKFSDLLKNKNLSDIICNKISNKYKKEDINKNKIIYEQIKDDLIFKNLFKENYLEFFKNIYYKSVNKINLIKYGLNKEIILPKNKVKMFKDLIEEKTEEDEDYIKNLHLCVAQNYLPKNTFLMY
jgi:hypothetical protein